MPNPTIGILTSQRVTPFFRRLVQEGQTLGANVFLFSPQDVSIAEKRIIGSIPGDNHRWKQQSFSWPDIVIDHYRYYPLPRHQKYLSFRQQELFLYANSRFSNKWSVHQVLCKDPEMNRWLPESVAFTHENLRDMLLRHKLVYMKPTNGTGGRSILSMERVDKGFMLHGRSKHQAKTCTFMPTLAKLREWVNRWVTDQRCGRESFFLQQGLHLGLLPDRTVDVRLLIQKDEEGKWDITGMGVRIGQPESSTSNLHGGGKAVRFSSFLSKRFGVERAKIIKRQCRQLAYLCVNKTEEHYGRMLEFGLDIGVDVNGRVWLIEMNPKPGRDIFIKLKQEDRYALAIRRPLQYALHLLKEDKQLQAKNAAQEQDGAPVESMFSEQNGPTVENILPKQSEAQPNLPAANG